MAGFAEKNVSHGTQHMDRWQERLKSGRARQTISLVRYHRPVTILKVQGKSSRAEKAKKIFGTPALTDREHEQ